ncbi:MAG: NAD(P)-dependent oxidoreductase [Pseudomonadota bacterium]
MLDRLASALEAGGHDVVRGSAIASGQVQHLDLGSGLDVLGQVDVAVLTGRTPIAEELLCACRRLRGVVAPSVGVEFIDLDAASRHGIFVANGATVENFISMAEATVMLAMMLLYRPDWSREVLDAQRERPPPLPESRWARTLSGRKVGLVGFGNIALRVTERLQAFGAQVLVADHGSLQRSRLPPSVVVMPLDDLLSSSDIVSLHVNAKPNQRALIGRRELALMKSDAYLINTARGALVEEQALWEALAKERIAGAALDTFEVEPLPAGSPLRSLRNVLLTPHMIGQTQELFSSLQQAAIANIHALLTGDIPPYCLNREIAGQWQQRWAQSLTHRS